MGNWNQNVTTVPPGGPVTQTRTHNKQNQLTSISTPDTTPAYDNNGNTTQDEKGRGLVYDAWDRLVEVKTSPTGSRLLRYTYDGLGRRVCETTGGQTGENLCVATGGTRRDFYQSKDWQVVEERLGGAVKAHYVWSLAYVDGLVLRDRNNDASPDLEERLYVQQDANWNVTAVVNISGGVVERSVYDPYGKPTLLNPTTWATLSGSTVAWQYLHQGGRYHDFGDGTGLYHFRNRELSAALGRWLEQDPIGFAAKDSNLYRDVGNNPVGRLDPFGLLDPTVGLYAPGAGTAAGTCVAPGLGGLALGGAAGLGIGCVVVVTVPGAAEGVAEALNLVEPFRPRSFPAEDMTQREESVTRRNENVIDLILTSSMNVWPTGILTACQNGRRGNCASSGLISRSTWMNVKRSTMTALRRQWISSFKYFRRVLTTPPRVRIPES